MDGNVTLKEVFRREISGAKSKFRDPRMYINRELSWIEFNRRVLHHICRKDVPLLERFKFLGITASNLDEFIMVRFSSIINKVMREQMEPDIAGLLPHEEYMQVLAKIKEFKELQEEGYIKLWKKLEKHNISLVKPKRLSSNERDQMERIFDRHIYPLLTPIAFDTTKAFPVIKSGQINIIVCLEDNKNPNLNVVAIIPIDVGMKRVYELDVKKGEDRKIILLEDIIMSQLHKIFVNKPIIYSGAIRILREADIELERNEDVYIVDRMRQTLRKRELSHPIFMDVDWKIPKDVLKLMIKIFGIDKDHVHKTRSGMDMSYLKSLPIDIPELQYEPFSPQYPEELISEHDMFTAIDNGDLVLHHPYESFGPVVKFLEHAADDKHVKVIKQTLYRVSSIDSPIVDALCRAAKKGKNVSVLLEIKARFDEGRNISLIEKLESAGCKIVYGVEDYKTHCKIIVVVRETPKGLKKYCHFGTGNYNENTSTVYTDISYFTSNNKMANDAVAIFNILSGFSEPRDEIDKLFYAPYNIRMKLYELIDREAANAEKGKKAFITLKLNSLSDAGIIRRLYEAANKGVKISIICRGICSMKPINKNIAIKSVIGRYLEHSRIYYFYNNGKMDLFISSADLLTRNLDRRVEVMVPIMDTPSKEKIMNILSSYFNDSVNTYIMNKTGAYETITEIKPFNVHEYFMNIAINNYKLRNIPKMSLKQQKKRT